MLWRRQIRGRDVPQHLVNSFEHRPSAGQSSTTSIRKLESFPVPVEQGCSKRDLEPP